MTVKVGDLLNVKAPAGQFVLDKTSDRARCLHCWRHRCDADDQHDLVVARLINQSVDSYLFYGARYSSDHAFKALLEGFAQSHTNFTLNVLYGAPCADDVEGRDFQHVGFVDVALLKRVLPHGRHQFYVCGPPAMMAALVPALADWGVPKTDINFESLRAGILRLYPADHRSRGSAAPKTS